jgi:signal transduction histidine kinase
MVHVLSLYRSFNHCSHEWLVGVEFRSRLVLRIDSMSASGFAYTCLHSGYSLKLRMLFTRSAALIWLVLLIVSEAMAAESASPQSSGFLVSQSYYVDQSGSADFENIVDADFTPFNGSLSKGYISAPVWLRLRVAATPVEQSLIVFVDPPFLQRLELYDPARANFSADEPGVSGREERSPVGSFDGISNGFVIASSSTERDIFIRLVSKTTILADVSILTQDEARNSNIATLVILGIYLALLMMFAIWGGINFILRRESIYGYFVLRQVSSVAHACVFFGFVRIFFGDNLSLASRETIYSLVIVTLLTFSGLFDFKIISQHNPSKILLFIFGAILGFPAVSVVLIMQGLIGEALLFNKLAINACVVTLLLLAMSVRSLTDNPLEQLAVWVIRIGYLITSITVLLPVLMYLNFLPGLAPFIKLIFIHAIVSNIVMLTLLMIQNRQREQSLQEARLNLQLKDVELEIENKKREDKERFLSMIIHELRNPLSVVRVLTDKSSDRGQSVHQAVTDMAQVIERVEQSEKLSSGELVIERTSTDVMHLIHKLLGDREAANRWKLSGPPNHILETDQQLFRGIMINLFDNAEKYSPEGSILSVKVGEATADQPVLLLEVSNEVSDLLLPDPKRIFERYYRSKGAHRTLGSGLGLFLVQGWVEAMGGSIEGRLNGEQGHGHVFTMFLRLPA